MEKLLQKLADTKIVKVTGSFADNTQNENSDIDFYVLPDKPDTEFLHRRMLKIIKILNKHNIKWNSNFVGYISTINEDNNLPIELEFSHNFKPRKNKLKEVKIMGVAFKTY